MHSIQEYYCDAAQYVNIIFSVHFIVYVEICVKICVENMWNSYEIWANEISLDEFQN